MANGDSINLNLNSTKSGARPSHEAIEQKTGEATDLQDMDRVAMESAKRAQNRIHNDEGTVPGSTIISK